MSSLLQIWLSRLAAPEDALFNGSVLLLIVAVTTYVLLRCWPNSRTSRFAALIGELAVVAGVIGVFSLVGKTYMEFAKQEIGDSVQRTRVKLATLTSNLETACQSTAYTGSPTKANGAFATACERFKNSQRAYLAREDPALLASQYEQISKMDNLDPSVARQFESAKVEAEALSDLFLKSHTHEYYENRHSRLADWPLVLLCALSVAFGAGVKCGRAFADLVNNWSENKPLAQATRCKRPCNTNGHKSCCHG